MRLPVLVMTVSHPFRTDFLSLSIVRTPTSTLFPYTTLFRSDHDVREVAGLEQAPALDLEIRCGEGAEPADRLVEGKDRKSTRLNSSHLGISYAVFCLKKKIARINQLQEMAQAYVPRTSGGTV